MTTTKPSPWSFFSTTFLLSLFCAASVPVGTLPIIGVLGNPLGKAINAVAIVLVGISIFSLGSIALARSLTELWRAIGSGIAGLCAAAAIAYLATLVNPGDRTLSYAIMVASSASTQLAVIYLVAKQLRTPTTLIGLLVGLAVGSLLMIGTRGIAPVRFLSNSLFPVFFVWYAWAAIIWVSGSVGWYVGSTRRADCILLAWGVSCTLLLAAVWVLPSA